MSEVVLKNAGTGNTAKVDTNSHLQVISVMQQINDRACDSGIEQKFNINTGDITLTSANKTSCLYIKNESTKGDLTITALIYNLGNTTSGTGDVKIDVLRNPLAGDIITNTNSVLSGVGIEANQNFGSQNILVGKFYKGATGETALSGDDGVSISTRSASNIGRVFLNLDNVTLPKGASLGVDYTPPASNSLQIVQFAVACFMKTTAVKGE